MTFQCKTCLRYFASSNELLAHHQSMFKCERYDMDAIRYWGARACTCPPSDSGSSCLTCDTTHVRDVQILNPKERTQ
jgi:hypothetical protein